MDMQLVNVPRGEYEALKEDSLKLQALECLGVDNWQGYDDVHKLLDAWKAGKDWYAD